MQVRLDRQDHQKRMQVAGSTDIRRRRQRLYLPRGYAGVSRIEIDRSDKMRLRPFDESVRVGSDRSGWRIIHVLEDGIENWSCNPREISHEPIEVAEKMKRPQQYS